jgi:hypothetical protein
MISTNLKTARQRRRSRRGSEGFALKAGGLGLAAKARRYHKLDSAAGIIASDAAIAASRALQFGCPLDVLSIALTYDGRCRAIGRLGVALDMLAADA